VLFCSIFVTYFRNLILTLPFNLMEIKLKNINMAVLTSATNLLMAYRESSAALTTFVVTGCVHKCVECSESNAECSN
jgi:hypothetical protein